MEIRASSIYIRDQKDILTEDSTAQASVGPENDARTSNVMSTILSIEKPQLAVLNGDLITGEATHRSNSSSYVDRIVAPLVEQDVPWASTYGNHDSSMNLCPFDVFQRETDHENSFTQRMVFDSAVGFTNYFLPLFPHNLSVEVPDVILWFFDTRGGNWCSEGEDESGTRPDWVHQSVSFLCYTICGAGFGVLAMIADSWR